MVQVRDSVWSFELLAALPRRRSIHRGHLDRVVLCGDPVQKVETNQGEQDTGGGADANVVDLVTVASVAATWPKYE